MYQQAFGASAALDPLTYNALRPSTSSFPITQQQQPPFPRDVASPRLRPSNSLRHPTPFPEGRPFPTGPRQTQHQTSPFAPPLTHQHQQATTPTIASLANNRTNRTPTPKGSKPTGITKRGRKPKDHDKSGFINTTVPPGEHFNATKYGRNSLRGHASEARLAEPWNQPSVRVQSNSKSGGDGEGEGEGNGDERPLPANTVTP